MSLNCASQHGHVRGTYLFYVYGNFDFGYILVYVALKRLQVDFLPYATGHIRGRWNISGLQWREIILVYEGSGGVYFPLAVATLLPRLWRGCVRFTARILLKS